MMPHLQSDAEYRDTLERDLRDALILAAERADQYAGHEYTEQVYVPTRAGAERAVDAVLAARQERRERVFLTVLALALVAWVVFLTAAYLLLDRAVS